MLVAGTPVRPTPDGPEIPVEALRPGNLLVDPLTGHEGRLLLILSREIDFRVAGVPIFQHLYPILIAKGSIDGIRPLTDIRVSPCHKIMIADASGYNMLAIAAQNLIGRPGITRDKNLVSCIYVLPIADRPMKIEFAGIAVECMALIGKRPPSASHAALPARRSRSDM